MINIAVCDDDSFFLDMLHAHIQKFFADLHTEVRISLFHSPMEFWEEFCRENFHIVILDIIMPELSGIELARRIFNRNRNCVIAFLTSSPDYALEGYGVNAVGYLLKASSRDKLDKLLHKCLQRHNEGRPPALLLKIGGVNLRVDTSDIIYLESKNKQVHIHCGKTMFMYSGKLSDIAVQLPRFFVQTHKSYVVNLEYARSMSRDEMTMCNDIRVPISRQYCRAAAQQYLDYVAGEL